MVGGQGPKGEKSRHDAARNRIRHGASTTQHSQNKQMIMEPRLHERAPRQCGKLPECSYLAIRERGLQDLACPVVASSC